MTEFTASLLTSDFTTRSPPPRPGSEGGNPHLKAKRQITSETEMRDYPNGDVKEVRGRTQLRHSSRRRRIESYARQLRGRMTAGWRRGRCPDRRKRELWP